MTDFRWTSFDLIFFDCDSTLSTIEGIDELAKLAGKEAEIAELTNKAMDGELDLREVYGERLRAINPTRHQLKEVEERYWETTVPDAEAVIAALHALGKHVFIVSGGLAEPVRGFGRRLGVAPERVRAVELEFDALSGEWWRYYDSGELARQKYLDYFEGPLTISSGKPDIVDQLAGDIHGKRLFIGDGASDLATASHVDLFVGFGGVVARERVQQEAPLFITVNSLAQVLALAAGSTGYQRLQGTPHQKVFDRGLAQLRRGDMIFNNPDFENALTEEFA